MQEPKLSSKAELARAILEVRSVELGSRKLMEAVVGDMSMLLRDLATLKEKLADLRKLAQGSPLAEDLEAWALINLVEDIEATLIKARARLQGLHAEYEKLAREHLSKLYSKAERMILEEEKLRKELRRREEAGEAERRKPRNPTARKTSRRP